MDIKDIDKFAALCAERGNDKEFLAGLQIAERIADIVAKEEAQSLYYGGPYEPDIDKAFNEVRGSVDLTNKKLAAVEALLGNHWEHQGAFRDWFSSKVIIVGK